MKPTSPFCRVAFAALAAVAVLGFGSAARAQQTIYRAITSTMENQIITLDGHTMTTDQLVAIARGGAKVAITDEARQREADQYGLVLEASAEGIPVYWFNRGAGQNREVVIFEGDPLSPDNKAMLEKRQLANFQRGPRQANGPEISDEEIVRGMMAVRVNAMTYDAPSPQLAQMLIDLLNTRITPVVLSRGTVGEGDLEQFMNIAGTMVGVGEAYYKGVRMKASEALQRAALKPLQPFAADDNALTSSNAYATAQATFLVHDAKAALEWADLIYAIDLNG
jgi:histidine ammonia-lyase